MLELTVNKKHDESRQGEAFAPKQLVHNPVSKKFYIESYGCAMNFADSEVVASILKEQGFGITSKFEVILSKYPAQPLFNIGYY